MPTALERAGDFSQSVDNNGNPFPYIRDYTTGLPCNSGNTSGCFADGGVLGRIPQSRLYAPGINALNIYPAPNFTAGSGINFTSQIPNTAERREDLLRLDFQATDRWRFTGRYMNTKEDVLQAYGTTWAGNGSDQLPIPSVNQHPGSNYLLSATGILNATTSLEVSFGRAHNSLDWDMQFEKGYRSNAGLTGMPLLFPDAVQADYIPDMRFRGGRTSNAGQYQTDRGPFTNYNTIYDALANLTKVWGAHSAKFGVYYQSSLKPQSVFASFNSQINFADDANNPFDTGYGYANAATGVFNTYTQANKFAIPEWSYKNIEWYAQDNWKASSTADARLRRALLLPDAAVGQDAPGLELPAGQVRPRQRGHALRPRLHRCLSLLGRRAARHGPRARGPDTHARQHVEGRFIGRLTPAARRSGSTAPSRPVRGSTTRCRTAAPSASRPASASSSTSPAAGRTIVRGGFGVFYDRPQGNMVFDMVANAPGVLNSTLQWGRLQDLTAAGGDPYPTVGLSPTVYDFKPPKVYSWNVGVQHKLWHAITLDLAYVGSSSKDLLRQAQINALPLGTTFLPQNQDPTNASTSTTPGAKAYTTDLLRPYQGYGAIRMWDYSAFSNYHSLQTSINRRFDNGFMFSAFYVWSKVLGISGNADQFQGRPNVSEEETKRVDYSYADYDRPHNFVLNFVYQTPKVASGVLGVLANDWQISGIYRWTSGRPYAINYSIPGVGNTNLTGSDAIGARVKVTCDPGGGSSSDPYRQIDTSCFAPPQPGSDGTESARFFLWAPPIVNLDMSLSKIFPVGKRVKLEVRLDAFNALNHTQFTGVNNTVNFASLTDPTITNLPYDSSGNLVRNNGFGSINGVAPPRTLQLVTRLTF